ncbi:hypothetical protein QBC44DRAFT_374849 [Cladorrhinum sp. PSN332]|nr:hypothetical protein QBC44DRAFT_374849 [Cladorrhinum sp. PSN332]
MDSNGASFPDSTLRTESSDLEPTRPNLSQDDDQTRKDTWFWRACYLGNIQQAKSLLRDGANINTERIYYKLRREHRDNWQHANQSQHSVSSYTSGDQDAGASIRSYSHVLRYTRSERWGTESDGDGYFEYSVSGFDDEVLDRDPQADFESDPKYENLGNVSAIFVTIDERNFSLALLLLDEQKIEGLHKWYKGLEDTQSTALHQAVAERSGAIVQKLLSHAPVPKDCWIEEVVHSALMRAVERDNLDLIRIFLGTPDLDIGRHAVSKSLLKAVERSRPPRNVETARLLLIHGADVNVQDNDGNTPLHLASRNADLGMMKLLLAWKARKSVANEQGQQPCAPKGRSDVKGVLESLIWEKKDERAPAWLNKIPPSNEKKASKAHSADVTFCFYDDIDPFIWSQAMPISDLLKGNPDSSAGASGEKLSELERQFIGKAADSGTKIQAEQAWRWIHLPNTNMTWVNDVVRSLCSTYSSQDKERKYYTSRFVDSTRCARHEGNNSVYLRFPHAQSEPSSGRKPMPDGRKEAVAHDGPKGSRISLVVPFLDFESHLYPQRNSPAAVELRGDQEDLKVLETAYPVYNGSEGLQLPQTLDQSYYGRLTTEDLTERNTDQVVYKWFQQFHHMGPGLGCPGQQQQQQPQQERDTSPKILVVRQLWIWKLDERTVLSAIPRRWDSSYESPDSLICQILLHTLRFPDEFDQSGVGHHILDIFESWIAKQEDREVSLYKTFRRFIEHYDVKKKDDESEQNALNIADEVDIIYELKDTLAELFILEQLFTTQLETCKSWVDICVDYLDGDIIQQSRIHAFIERVSRLKGNADRVLGSVVTLVQVKQAQSSLIESQPAGDQAEIANIEAKRSRKLNNYVLLFTVVTIVFTPLAFMVGLFALTIDDWPRNDEGEPSYPSSWITGRLFAGELASLLVIAGGFFLIRLVNGKDEGKSQSTSTTGLRGGGRHHALLSKPQIFPHSFRNQWHRQDDPESQLRTRARWDRIVGEGVIN